MYCILAVANRISASPCTFIGCSLKAGQSQFVDKRLSQRRDGFYVECGAVDGETISNSLFFELERDWTGLLIEANPAYYSKLLAKNRKVGIPRRFRFTFYDKTFPLTL